MKVAHYITIAAAVALTGILYWGGNTIPPAQKQTAEMQRPSSGGKVEQGGMAMKPASLDSIIAKSKTQLSGPMADSVKMIEKSIAAISDSSQMAVLFARLSGLYERSNMKQAAAFYYARAAKLENSEKKLTFAGQLFLDLMESENSPSIQQADAIEAAKCLEKSLAINPGNEDTKLALATAYIEGVGEPMKGVQILLAIVREKPDDVPANMLLGRMSIQSGQFDKALGRFETVLKKEPENKEALFFLAQAYEGKGDKKKAVELLEKCKKVVNDPQFTKDIDNKINSLR